MGLAWIPHDHIFNRSPIWTEAADGDKLKSVSLSPKFKFKSVFHHRPLPIRIILNRLIILIFTVLYMMWTWRAVHNSKLPESQLREVHQWMRSLKRFCTFVEGSDARASYSWKSMKPKSRLGCIFLSILKYLNGLPDRAYANSKIFWWRWVDFFFVSDFAWILSDDVDALSGKCDNEEGMLEEDDFIEESSG